MTLLSSLGPMTHMWKALEQRHTQLPLVLCPWRSPLRCEYADKVEGRRSVSRWEGLEEGAHAKDRFLMMESPHWLWVSHPSFSLHSYAYGAQLASLFCHIFCCYEMDARERIWSFCVPASSCPPLICISLLNWVSKKVALTTFIFLWFINLWSPFPWQ